MSSSTTSIRTASVRRCWGIKQVANPKKPSSRLPASAAARLAGAALGASLFTAGAHAHAFLDSAVPRVGSIVRTAPPEVVLTFSQAVEPAFCRLEVTDQAGTHEETGAAHTEGLDAAKLAVGVGKLPPGTYFVTWHVTSVDTHKTQGRFPFTVAP